MPREPDDLDDVIGQVSVALDELEVVQGADRDALLESLRDVLGAMEVPGRPPTEPQVAVLDGGRDPDSARAPGARGRLKLAPAGGAAAESPPRVARFASVRVQAAGRDFPSLAGEPLSEPPGRIVLTLRAGASRAEQPIFQGRRPRTYRVRCVDGALHVDADGHALPPLAPGQTVDVEAQSLRVWSDAPCEGRYLRLRDPGP